MTYKSNDEVYLKDIDPLTGKYRVIRYWICCNHIDDVTGQVHYELKDAPAEKNGKIVGWALSKDLTFANKT